MYPEKHLAVSKMEETKPSSLGLYCEISTCMGVTDWYLAKPTFGKIFWASLVIAGLAVTLWQTHATIRDYCDANDFTIRVSKENQVDGVQFPFITLCNFNRARQSVINKTNLDPNVLSAIFQLFPASYDLPLSLMPKETIDLYENTFENYIKQIGERDYRNFFRVYGHQLNQSVIGVSFANGIEDSVKTEVFTIYGLCFRININGKQMIPGSFAGVKMMLNPQLDEYMNDVVINNYFQQGFAISLSYSDDPLMSDALMLAPGTASNIVIKTSRNSLTDMQYPIKPKPCRKNVTLNILKAEYTTQNCIFDCYMQTILKKCGCVLFIETQTYYPVCNVSTSINCANTNSRTWAWNIGADVIVCAKDCRNPCNEFLTVESTMSTTVQQIINREKGIQIVKQRNLNLSDNYVKGAVEHSILAKIYFATSDMIIVETCETTPIMTFISNIGGQLGLWMGISMFSIIQFIYYLTLTFINGEWCCKSKKINAR